MDTHVELLQALADAGIPNTLRFGLFQVKGIQEKVAVMLVGAVKTKGLQSVSEALNRALVAAGHEVLG